MKLLALFGLLALSCVSAQEPVLMELYYESLCPYCQDFIATQMTPTWDNLESTGRQAFVYILFKLFNDLFFFKASSRSA